MTDYTQNVSYTPKDALSTGDAAKRIKGSEIDAEFAEIATAISSKEDAADKGVASGYCGLDASALVAVANLPAATDTAKGVVELATTAEAVTGTDTARAVTAAGVSAVLDQNGGLLRDLAGFSDPNADYILFWDDSAGQVNYLGAGSQMSISGTSLVCTVDLGNLSATNLTSGTIPAARVGASSVTQHQASLTILESQITDSTVLARVAANETISGTWTFSTGVTVPAATVTAHQASLSIAETQIANGTVFPRLASAETISGVWTYSAVPIYSGAGAFPHFASATQTSGAITVSTAAASGTPAAGDLWIQYAA
jgi:hypothetical protein